MYNALQEFQLRMKFTVIFLGSSAEKLSGLEGGDNDDVGEEGALSHSMSSSLLKALDGDMYSSSSDEQLETGDDSLRFMRRALGF